jgi:hypothetical protein
MKCAKEKGKIFKLEGKSVDEEENAKILMQIFR